jgi:hypothetical protein
MIVFYAVYYIASGASMGVEAVVIGWLIWGTSCFLEEFTSATRERHEGRSWPKRFVGAFITPLVICILGLVPPFIQTLSVHLLSEKYPVINALVTGVCFPGFEFMIRKAALTYFANEFQAKCDAGAISASVMARAFQKTCFVVSTQLLFSTVTLMYLNTTWELSLLSSSSSILIEVCGKLWVCFITNRRMGAYIKKKLTSMSTSANEAYEATEANDADDADEEGGETDERWRNFLDLMAMRWGEEIIAEKICIVVGAVVAHLFLDVTLTAGALSVIFACFFCNEQIADTALVGSLDKFYNVPFLARELESIYQKRTVEDGIFMGLTCLAGTTGLHYAHIAVVAGS